MAETTFLARPYARAVFELAQAGNALGKWSEQLMFLAAAAHTPEMQAIIESPRLSKEQQLDLFKKACDGNVDAQGQNLLTVLVENDRLELLPEIAAIYEHMKNEAEGSVEATLISALPLDDAQQAAVVKALKARLGREVRLVCEVDESLMGGAVIHAGDLVIDGSVKGRLEKMRTALGH
ncbi:MAG: F0F1 ATP synthase subunit delta [Gammaproteobacteria bacterium]|jgi:F-type H+-transporting ATPase subunit delta